MYYYGVVTQVNKEDCTVRVALDTDDIVTPFLSIGQRATFTDKGYRIFDVNEHVFVMYDAATEVGMVVDAVYNDEDAPGAPATGAGEHSLVLRTPAGAETVSLAASRTAGTATVQTKNKLALGSTSDEVSITGETRVRISATGKIKIDAGGVNLHNLFSKIGNFLSTHKHAVAGATTTVLSPDDITKAAAIVADIDLMLE